MTTSLDAGTLTWRGRRQLLVARLERQGTVITAELHALGFSDGAITRLQADGVVVRVHRGVYRAGGAQPGDALDTTAALSVPSAGRHRQPKSATRRNTTKDARASRPALVRESAAYALGYLDRRPHEVHVGVVSRHGRSRRERVRVHKAPGLRESEVIVVDGHRCTTPERTILDLADGCRRGRGERLLRRVLRQAAVADPALPGRLELHLERERPFRGCRTLEAALRLHRPETAAQRSSLESDFIAFCIESGIPLPQTNVRAEGHELDAAWVRELVYAELDAYTTHGGVREFESDRARDADLVVAGWRGIRVTPRRLNGDRLALRTQLLQLLGLAP